MTVDEARAIAGTLTKIWETEFPATCKVLAAVKDDAREYRPDPKSRSAWELATHLATSDIWFMDSIIAGSFNFDPAKEKETVASFGRVADVVAFYEREFPARMQAIKALPGDRLAQVNDFFGIFQWPNVEFIGFANNHSMHHRGQLAASLRAMGSRVPAIYGGSADEPAQAG